MVKKSDYLFLGIALALIVLALLQIARNELIPVAIYWYIAWAAAELTFLELVKTIMNTIINSHNIKI